MVALGLAGVVILVAAYTGRLLASRIIHGAGLLAASVRDGRRRLEPAHRMPAPALRVVQTYPTPALRQQWRAEGMRPAA